MSVCIWRSIVAQSCTLPDVGKRQYVGPIRRSAEYHSTIWQIENLHYTRYTDALCRPLTAASGSRKLSPLWPSRKPMN